MTLQAIQTRLQTLADASANIPETLQLIEFLSEIGGILKEIASDGKIDISDLQYLDDVVAGAVKAYSHLVPAVAEWKKMDFASLVSLGGALALAGKNLFDGIKAIADLKKPTVQPV